MNSSKSLEELESAAVDIKRFVDLSRGEQLTLIEHFDGKLQKVKNDNLSEKELDAIIDIWQNIVEPLTEIIFWYLKLKEMREQGWDMSRRDSVFFSTLQSRDPSITREHTDQLFDLVEKYLQPADQARKAGQIGKAERLEKLYHRQVAWLYRDRDREEQ